MSTAHPGIPLRCGRVVAETAAVRGVSGRVVVVAGPRPVSGWRGVVAAARAAVGLPVGEPFGVLVAADATGAGRDGFEAVVQGWVRDGVFWVSTWGPGCEWLHDRVDDVDVMVDIDEPGLAPGTVVTTWHDSESAAEVAGWVLAAAEPSEDRSGGRLLLVVVDDVVDAGELVDTVFDSCPGAVLLGGPAGEPWWRCPVAGVAGLSRAELVSQLLAGDGYASLTAGAELGRVWDGPLLGLATGLLVDPDPERRVRGAGVLGVVFEVGHASGRRPPGSVVGALLTAAAGESELVVVEALVGALCSSGDSRALAWLTGLTGHPDRGVRESLGVGLPGFGPGEPAAVAAVRRLLDDEDPDVRDWASFAYVNGLETVDDPGLRDRLLELAAGDGVAATRYQAIGALAARGDRRVLPALAEALSTPLSQQDAGVVDLSLVEHAARAVADPALLPGLRAYQAWTERLRQPDGTGESGPDNG